jgi:hypothetical protein
MNFRRSQSRTGSLLEAGANVLVGFLLALLTQRLAYPLFGIHTGLADDAAIAGLFTAVSLVRGFLLRRIFERIGTGRGRENRLQRGCTYRLVEEP